MATKVVMQDQLTRQIAVEMKAIDIESIDLTELRASFEACRSKMTDGVTLPVHRLVYEQDYLLSNSKVIGKFVNQLYANHRELNIETVVGKLAKKLPFPKGFFDAHKLTNFQKQECRYVLAAVLVELLAYANILRLDTRLVYDPKPKSMTYVILGTTDAPTDILAGYDTQPGQTKVTHTSNGFRVKSVMKAILADLGTMPFKISDWFDEALLIHGYKLSAAYNAPSKNESAVKRQYRFEHTYKNAWLELKGLDQFYLPVYPDGRLRLYYTANVLYGARPQGKLWETLAIDRAEPKILSNAAAAHIQHVIMSVLEGNMSVGDAAMRFTDEHLKKARAADPLAVPVPQEPYEVNPGAYRAAEQAFGECILLNKCAEALYLYDSGKPCPYLFGKDLTNSGLIMAGNSFRSQKMLEGANCYGSDDVADSHMQFGRAHGVAGVLTRRQIKDIHTPLLHGSSAFTIMEKLKFYSDDPDSITLQAVQEHNVEAYGHEVNNIEQIAAFGYSVVDNYRNKLSWKLPDGEIAYHEAVVEHVPFRVFAVSTRTKGAHYRSFNLTQTMPLAVDSQGQNAFASDTDRGTHTKRRGLFANITHSLDGYVLRTLVTRLREAGEVFLLKHDDYMLSPDAFDLATDELQVLFSELQQENLYQSALDQIALSLGVEAPQLLVGDADNRLKDSYNFLMV